MYFGYIIHAAYILIYSWGCSRYPFFIFIFCLLNSLFSRCALEKRTHAQRPAIEFSRFSHNINDMRYARLPKTDHRNILVSWVSECVCVYVWVFTAVMIITTVPTTKYCILEKCSIRGQDNPLHRLVAFSPYHLRHISRVHGYEQENEFRMFEIEVTGLKWTRFMDV